MDFYYVLDNVMKQKSAQGLGQIQQSEVISKQAEDKMWSDGLLGESHPQQLCDTVLYLLGINLALHRGKEHKNLW